MGKGEEYDHHSGIYAPTHNYDDAVETFYDELEDIIKKIPKKDLLVINGRLERQRRPRHAISGREQWCALD